MHCSHRNTNGERGKWETYFKERHLHVGFRETSGLTMAGDVVSHGKNTGGRQIGLDKRAGRVNRIHRIVCESIRNTDATVRRKEGEGRP